MSRRAIILEDFQNKDGLCIGERFTPTADDVARLQKAGRFKGIIKIQTGTANGQLPATDAPFFDRVGILIPSAIQVLGHPPGNGFDHDIIDLDTLA